MSTSARRNQDFVIFGEFEEARSDTRVRTRTNQRSIRPLNDRTALDGTIGPIRCPNGSSCGSYYTAQTENCTEDNADQCSILEPESYCCGKYTIAIDPTGIRGALRR
jgi:hypothetical protein